MVVMNNHASYNISDKDGRCSYFSNSDMKFRMLAYYENR